jgi:tetratricopeptide (TPR) repeat protein
MTMRLTHRARRVNSKVQVWTSQPLHCCSCERSKERLEMKEAITLVVILLFLLSGRSSAGEEVDPKAAFSRGVSLMEQRQFREAIPYLKVAEKSFPKAPPILWNLGIATSEVADYSDALIYWKKYRKVSPEDWRAIAKLIQAYQATGDMTSRNRELEALYSLRAGDPSTPLGKAEKFCREQFVLEGIKVFALEFFDPQGDRMVFYRFSIVNQDGRSILREELESVSDSSRGASTRRRQLVDPLAERRGADL